MSKHYQIPPDLRDNLAKKLDAIIEMADELITGNVAHKKAAIKGFALRMKEWLIKST